MSEWFGYYQDLVGLLPPSAQLVISGVIIIVLFLALMRFFIRNIFLLIIFLLFAPIYWPVIRNFIENIQTVLAK